jgi:hypothetical protein
VLKARTPSSLNRARLFGNQPLLSPKAVAQLGVVSQIPMPCEFLIDTERRLVVSRGTGTFRYADFLEHMEKLGLDSRFKPEFDHVVDCQEFELMDLSVAQVRDMGSQSNFAASSRRAFVVSSDLHFGLGRMFAAFREVNCGQVTMVFRDMREATDWLELPRDYDPSSLGAPTQIAKNG